jgi:threonylcarbamoyladenosine tRNA methylthiotransferase MtaB
MKIGLKTFGCKANSLDTDALCMEARLRGYEVVDEEALADAYIINSCTVTSHADRDARAQIGKFKRRNPAALVAVVGCYAQVAKEELLQLPEVDVVLGTADKDRVFDHFVDVWAGTQKVRDHVSKASGFLPQQFSGSRNARASIKIQDGCNFSCSFCIIPQARGRSRSLPVEKVLNQVREAYASGFREVILTGVHLAHYGWDIGSNLMELLKILLGDSEGPRIRLTTLDPFEIPDELIELVASEKRLCPHYHIAIQSGSNTILKRMRRIYRAEEFVDVTLKINERDPGTFIGVDVIVGFPGEDEKEFAETVKILDASPWSKLHVFSFSLRKGTRAEEYTDAVPSRVIAARSESLRNLSQQRYSQFLDSQLGSRREVILERKLEKEPDVWLGHTENYIPTLSRLSSGETKNSIAMILDRVEKDKVWSLRAERNNPEVGHPMADKCFPLD